VAAELRLTFTGAADMWLVQIAPNWGGQPSQPLPFRDPLGEKDYADLRWYLEEFMDYPDAGFLLRAARVERRLEEWGHRLYAQLFSSGDNRDLANSLTDADAPGLLSITSDQPAVLRIPWELMRDHRGPLMRAGVTIRRQFVGGRRSPQYAIRLPLRILLVVSRPEDAGWIDPRWTTRGMLDALDALAGQAQVDFCRPPTLTHLEKMLSEARRMGEPYHILHFEGHGDYSPEVGLGVLAFERAAPTGEWPSDLVPADRFGDILAHANLPLVVLEACRSSDLAHLPIFTSVAPRLLEAGVGSVIGMSHSVHIDCTRILLERFYSELARGASVGEALDAGRAGLVADPARRIGFGSDAKSIPLSDWFVPTLYQRGSDPVLVAQKRRARRASTVSASRPPSEDLPPAPIYSFHGRDRELHQLERAFRQDRVVVVHAMGGMGKTALAREATFWWHRTRLFPDGACFMSFERGADAERAVQVLGAYLVGHEFGSLPESEQWAEATRLFQERQVLVVWDNFESTLQQFNEGPTALYDDEKRAQLRNLCEQWVSDPNGKGRLLVTCRVAETGLARARRFGLAGLARPDSLTLTTRVLERHGINREDPRLPRDEIGKLLELMGDHPLSIELVMPHLGKLTAAEAITSYTALLEEAHRKAEEAAAREGRQVERNESLLASLRFSSSHLSSAAQAALPWLAWFTGGVFEQVLLAVGEIPPDQWTAVRAELEGLALVSADDRVKMNGGPYLRFHPTLPYGANPDAVPQPEPVRRRFVGVYLDVARAVRSTVFGGDPRGAMEVTAREEGNLRLAVARALEIGDAAGAGEIGHALSLFLQMSGRLRERDRLAKWLADGVERSGWSEAAAIYARERAWTLFLEGKPQEAISHMRSLIHRLEETAEFDPSHQLALTRNGLGQIYSRTGLPEEAFPLLTQAAAAYEKLQPRGRNHAACLADLSNAFRDAGRHREALEAAEQSLTMMQELKADRDVAAGHGLVGSILTDIHRYKEAAARYEQALVGARAAGDRETEVTVLQHLGSLAHRRNDYGRAIAFYKEAMKAAGEMGDEASVMRSCNQIGIAEQSAGRLAEARAWYVKAKDIATRRQDSAILVAVAHNLGVVAQKVGEAARGAGDEAAALCNFHEAEQLLQESLGTRLQQGNPLRIAETHTQLGRLQVLLGDLGQAERHARHALAIQEELGLADAWVNYETLQRVADARGDTGTAADWGRRKDEALADLRRRENV
jgi:tetratricopeptide (TPR) repeat protein